MTETAFRVRHIDLSAVATDSYDDQVPALSIFWWGHLPLGMRASSPEELPFGTAHLRHLSAEYVAAQLAARAPELGAPLRAGHEGHPKPRLSLPAVLATEDPTRHLAQLAAPATTSAHDISVVICTRDRGAGLADCLSTLAGQRSAPGEIVVVDNSRHGAARPYCEPFPSVRYIHEPQPGLSVARNAGVKASSKGIIAFTDDDVEVDAGWTAEIARVFETTDCDALTGLVLPARLDTPAQRAFQFEIGGFCTNFVPRLFDRGFFEETRPGGARVWTLGAGANMAFRRSVFQRIGLFDARLGAGAAGCSEDSEFWYRLLGGGSTCLYEPRAVVFHHHRADWPGLARQMRAYMKGHVAALVVQYDNSGDLGNLHRIRQQLPAYFVRTLFQAILDDRPDRIAILKAEVAGWLAGLPFLLRAGWRNRRAAQFAPPPIHRQTDGEPG